MGVSGAGKTEIGRRLAAALGGTLLDADDFHTEVNREKMRSGIPLDDEDRRPWLEALSQRLGREADVAGDLVLACSALKRCHREILLRGIGGAVQLIWLNGPREVIMARLLARRGHFMPPGLLDSQLKALEPPGPDEDAIEVEISASPEQVAVTVLMALRRS